MAVLANQPIGTVADQQSNYRILADADVVNAASATWVHLNDGGKLWLGSGSRGIFHKNRLTLEKGRARLDVREGYEVQARGVSLYPKGPLSTATVGFLNNGNLAVAVWEGSLRIAAGSTVLENVMPGEILEFAPPQTTGSTGSPGGGGPMPGGGLAGPCPAQICVNGPISYEGNGDTLKAIITDETTGAKIELVGAAANLQARGVKAGTRLIVAGTVASRAAPADNTGLKLKDITTFPLNGPAPKILRFCGSIANANGKYYITITWPDALLSFEIVNPGTALKKVLDNSLKPNKPKFRRRPVCLSGVVKPPAVGNVLPTIEDTRVAQLDIESDNRFVGALVLATVSATTISVTTAVIVDSGGGGVVSPTRP